jgi:hypothetical protein
MSSYNQPNIKVFVSNEDMSAKQFHLVKLTASQDGKKVSLAGAGEKAIGVVMNAPASGEDAEVALLGGGALLKCEGTVAAGDSLAADAANKGKVGTAGQWCPAIALEDGADEDVISVILNGHHVPDGT